MKNNILDLRFIIGLFFGITGLLLVFTSFLSQSAVGKSETTNFWSGVVYVAFGIFMIILWLMGKKEPVSETEEAGEPENA